MEKLRTAAALALMAGLAGSAYWVSQPKEAAKAENASALPKISACRPHDDCARMSRQKTGSIEANISP